MQFFSEAIGVGQFQLVINALTLASIYIMISAGLTIIYGVLKILHVAHGAVYVFGAYYVIVIFGFVNNVALSILLSSLLAGVVGVLIFLLVYKRLLSAPRLIPLVASIGVYYFAYDAFRLRFGGYAVGFPSPVSAQSIIPYFHLSAFQLSIMLVTAVSMIGTWVLLTRTKLGLSLRAVAMDMDMASALGINSGRIIILAFFLGSFLAGLAGSMVSVYYNNSYYTLGDTAIAVGLAVIVLGGLGSVSGAIIAAIIIAVVQTILEAFAPTFIPPFTVAFLILIAILIFRPKGLGGKI